METSNCSIIVERGDFGSVESTTFSNFNILSLNDISLAADLVLYPNPSTGIVNFSNTKGIHLKYEIYNVLGQIIF